MLVEIPIPSRCSSKDEKQKFVEELIKWGEENLSDQKNWRYKTILLRSGKLNLGPNSDTIRLQIDEETDGLAIKLAWCEE